MSGGFSWAGSDNMMEMERSGDISLLKEVVPAYKLQFGQ